MPGSSNKRMNKLYKTLGLVILLLPVCAVAAHPCGLVNVGGAFAGCTPKNSAALAIPLIVNTMFAVATGVSVLFIIVGAFFLLTSGGEEGRITRGKTAIVYSLIGMAIVLTSQTIVAYAITRFGVLAGAGNDVVFVFMTNAVNLMTNVFTGVFVIMLIYAGFKMVFARGSPEEFSKSRNILLWAIAGAIAANIARSLVYAVMNIPF